MFNGEVSVHGPVQGTRLPGSESGACWLVPCSPWPPPFAPPTPAPVARRRSPASQLLWRGLTSHARASPASAHHLPDADQGATALARREISRFPDKERTHMLGSTTAPGRPGARDDAPGHVAFRSKHSVGDPGVVFSRLNTQPMRTLSTLHQHPHGCQRMTRGQCGSLDLHWERLALSTPCRSPGARIVTETEFGRATRWDGVVTLTITGRSEARASRFHIAATALCHRAAASARKALSVDREMRWR